MREESSVFGSYTGDLKKIMDKFNESTKGLFIAESRILIPSESQYELDKRGIIIEYNGEDFEADFEKYEDELYTLAHKLDKRTSLYEYPFKSEFCNKDKWQQWGDKIVAYNFEL